MNEISAVAAQGTTVSETVYRSHKADILSGAIASGSALLTRDLLARYECGISPLREALARLNAEPDRLLQ